MKLRKGMWVVTNDRLHVGKIKDFCTCDMCKERGFYEPIIDNPNIMITNYDKERKFHGYKFYNNLTEFIQEGDYIDGLRVDKNKYGELYTGFIYLGGSIGLTEECYVNFIKDYNENLIDDIVTKEQFESVKYNID